MTTTTETTGVKQKSVKHKEKKGTGHSLKFTIDKKGKLYDVVAHFEECDTGPKEILLHSHPTLKGAMQCFNRKEKEIRTAQHRIMERAQLCLPQHDTFVIDRAEIIPNDNHGDEPFCKKTCPCGRKLTKKHVILVRYSDGSRERLVDFTYPEDELEDVPFRLVDFEGLSKAGALAYFKEKTD